MPPKKVAAKGKATPSKDAAATAAATRPRRAAAQETPAPTPAKKAAAAKAPAEDTISGKKRGRPPKAEQVEAEPETLEPPKKRGRPAKGEPVAAEPEGPSKKRGRSAKAVLVEAEPEEPPKNVEPAKTDRAVPSPKRGRGRPAKTTTTATDESPAVPEGETAPPKKRGRPPKGGETTKITEDDPAAAEQLEEELQDAVENADEARTSKRAPPAKKGKAGAKGGAAAKGKGRKGKQTADVEDAVVGVDGAAAAEDEEVVGEDDAATAKGSGQQYWLMKAEQVDREETLADGSVFNAKFTIDDLRGKAGPEPWDGVRNPTACKNMREMKKGDLAFFYASGGKGKTLQPGITGIMEIVKEHEPDMSAFDEKHPYYVQNAKQRGTPENPRWSLVHVEFRKKLSQPVSLKELQQYKHDSGVLANMQEFTAARLSVSKVSEKEWNFIVDNLIEGYEDEAVDEKLKQDNVPAATSNSAEGSPEDSLLPAATTTTMNVDMTDPLADEADAGDNAAVLPTSETVAPSVEAKKGTSRASSRKPSSRPTSRAPSRASSKGPAAQTSQSNSLAPPPRAQSRGRSRTPASRAASVRPRAGVAEEMETVEE